MEQINYFAVILAAILNMVIGYLWYSPMILGKQWMKLSGVTEGGMKKDMGKAMGMMIVASLITAFVLAQFVAMTDTMTIGGAAVLAFWLWLGFTATAMYSSVIYERRNPKLWAINVGYYLVAYIVMAAVIALW